MDEAEVEEVIHLIERQKKRLHFAGSLLRVQPATSELRQLTAFHGLSDQELAKVPLGFSEPYFNPKSPKPKNTALLYYLTMLVRLRLPLHGCCF